ncbi:MAG: hypothetical protein J6T48_03685 [Bacteroidales bacterium]|nr:hypothetical protein [Bacteroidales bacterium]
MGKIEIIEKYSISKYNRNNLNEDGFFINNSFVAVVDGATSKTGIVTNGKTGGQILRDNILNVISNFPFDICCIDAVKKIQNQLICDAPVELIGRAAASAIIYSVERHEIWAVGDCQMLVGETEYTFKKKIDELLAELRSFAIRAFIKKGKSIYELQERDLARELIQPFLLLQSEFENEEDYYGYCVFNNFTTIDRFPYSKVNIITIEQGMIVLASDGYPKLKKSFNESEKFLKEVIERDPLCYIENSGTKGIYINNNSYDDRTYVRFRIVD